MGTYYNNNGVLVPIAGRGSGVNRNDVAYVETGTTASRNYSVGQLVYVSGALYRVKSAIQNGQTFTVGTNVEATTVGGEIQRINNDLFDATAVGSVWTSPNIKANFYKYGRIVFVSLESAKADKNYATNDTMDDIPDAYRPIISASTLDTIPPSTTPIKRITFSGTSSPGSGHIYALASFAQNENIRGFITYISAE